MPRTLSYADAVRLLGGEGTIVKALDRITGGLALATAAAGGAPALLGWLAARGEFIRLSHDLIRTLSERRSGLSRYSRTQRIEAAHTVLVVVAYFEALAEAELPFDLAELELTADDQASLAAGTMFALAVNNASALVPAPHAPYGDFARALHSYYAALSVDVAGFVRCLAVWDRMSDTDHNRLRRALDDDVPRRACDRYEELIRRLATEFPEFGWWAGTREHQATRAEIRGVSSALAGMERMLAEISTGALPDQRRRALAAAYRAALDRPIVSAGDVPEGLRLPSLGTGYVPTRFRATGVDAGAELSEESWWGDLPVRTDLEEFLTGHLTSSRATWAPLLVLGQPGSGKSVLTRVLAARLPPADFLPVRVALRDVSAAADLQDQIEQAIRSDTGERIEWPALARSAGDALPVVILDGFDELLQATGVSQTDYLSRVASFQQREADQGRPVAVIVTSRISVADRARVPEWAVAMRLEPFDDDRVAAWLDVWNSANAERFGWWGVAPLSADAVLAHRELAEQPLLLLMLALYDANGNALQQAGPDLRQSDLYERLLRSFARREVEKHQPGLPERDLERAVEVELRRLSVVAFAMFNRGSQWVTEVDLEADLPALLGEQPQPTVTGPHDLRAPLRPAEIVLGRFFFVHRAQASGEDARLETYEFLHATFGEFLVARLTWQVVCDLVAREAASTIGFSPAPVNDDLLHALLSFVVLSQRAPVVGFLTDLADGLSAPQKAATTDLLIRLFQVVHQQRSSRGYASYQPQALAVPARHAAYGANLVLLTTCVAGTIRVSQLYGRGADPVFGWRDEVMLWRSQLPSSGWWSIVDTISLRRIWTDGRLDLELTVAGDPPRPVTIDPYWSYDLAPEDDQRNGSFLHHEQSAENLRRTAYFLCRRGGDVAHHALEPLLRDLGVSVNTIVGWGRTTAISAAHALLDVWLLPLRDPSPEEQREVYGLCATIATHDFPPWDETAENRYAVLLLDRLATDPTAPPDLVADILNRFTTIHEQVAPHLVRCGLAHLGRDADRDEQIADAIVRVAGQRPSVTVEIKRWLGKARVAGAQFGDAYPSPIRDWT